MYGYEERDANARLRMDFSYMAGPLCRKVVYRVVRYWSDL